MRSRREGIMRRGRVGRSIRSRGMRSGGGGMIRAAAKGGGVLLLVGVPSPPRMRMITRGVIMLGGRVVNNRGDGATMEGVLRIKAGVLKITAGGDSKTAATGGDSKKVDGDSKITAGDNKTIVDGDSTAVVDGGSKAVVDGVHKTSGPRNTKALNASGLKKKKQKTAGTRFPRKATETPSGRTSTQGHITPTRHILHTVRLSRSTSPADRGTL